MPTKCSFCLWMEFPLYIWKVRRLHTRAPGTMVKGGLTLWQRGLSLPHGCPDPAEPCGPAAMPKTHGRAKKTASVAGNKRASLQHGWGCLSHRQDLGLASQLPTNGASTPVARSACGPAGCHTRPDATWGCWDLVLAKQPPVPLTLRERARSQHSFPQTWQLG